MSNVPVAAFDPVFFLQHCNIDRLVALWQTLYPQAWFPPNANPPAKDALTPFHYTRPCVST